MSEEYVWSIRAYPFKFPELCRTSMTDRGGCSGREKRRQKILIPRSGHAGKCVNAWVNDAQPTSRGAIRDPLWREPKAEKLRSYNET